MNQLCQTKGNDDKLDSDADLITGKTAQTNLMADQTDLSWDLGITPKPAKLGDYVWEDTNGDGIQDLGEPAVENVTVKLWRDNNGDGTPDDLIATKITDSNGEYLFDKLTPNVKYIVQFMLPTGRAFTTANVSGDDAKDSDADVTLGTSGVITLVPGASNLTIDAGLLPLPTATPTATATETPTATATNTATATETSTATATQHCNSDRNDYRDCDQHCNSDRNDYRDRDQHRNSDRNDYRDCDQYCNSDRNDYRDRDQYCNSDRNDYRDRDQHCDCDQYRNCERDGQRHPNYRATKSQCG
jgi:hypothetical protein